MIKLVAAAALAASFGTAHAQSFPTRPVTMRAPLGPAFYKAEIEKRWPVIKATNIRVE